MGASVPPSGVNTGASTADLSNQADATRGAGMVGFLPAGTGAAGRTVRSRLLDVVSVRDFGAAGDGATDDGPEIQAAIDAAYAAGGGTVYFPTGIYRTNQTITLKANVSLRGVGNKDSQRSVATLEAGPSLNGPTLVSDQANGAVIGTGIDGNPQRLQGSLIADIQIRNLNTTSLDCDAVRFTNAWTITLLNVGLRAYVGFAARLLDCNVIHWTEVFTAGPVFAESLADSKFVGCQIGPNDYPSVDNEYVTSTFWLSGAGAWKNLFVSNFIFNGANGVARAANLTSGVQNIACAGHGYTDGTPVVYRAASASAFDQDLTYYVKVVDANTIKLASSRANLNAGTYIAASATTAGDTFRIGGEGCMYLNDGASKNVLSGNRFDQGYSHGLYLRNAHRNAIVGNILSENGRANATAGISAMRITNGNDNAVTGNSIDGTDTVTGTGTSNQDVGLLIGAASARTKVAGNTITNHATASVQDGSTSTVYDVASVFVGAHVFEVRAGSPVLTFLTGSRRKAWALDAAADELVQGYAVLPNGASAWDVSAFITNLGAGAGNVLISAQLDEYADGDNISANEATTVSNLVAAPAQDVLKIHTFTSAYTPDGAGNRPLSVTFKRSGSDGTDTLANDLGFLGLLFKPRIN